MIFKLPYVSFILILSLNLVLGMIFLSLLHKCRKGPSFRRFRKIYILFFLIFTLSFAGIEAMILNTITRPLPEGVNFGYIIILGSGNRSRTTKERVKKAFEYAAEHPNVKIVVSGGKGQGEKISEAESMAKRLIDFGINPKRILLEKKSRTTYENIKFSYEIIKKQTPEKVPVLIVTSDFHLFRAIMIAEKMGLDAYGLPSISPFYFKINAMVREYFAFIKDWFFLTFMEPSNKNRVF